MRGSERLLRAAALLVACALVGGGCGTGPGASGRPGPGATAAAATRLPQERPPAASPARPRPVKVGNWEAFAHASAALDRQVAALVADQAAARPRHSPAELASLRLAQRARDMTNEGRVEATIDLAERAIALWGGNGFANLWLAYAHHQSGRPRTAEAFASRAGSALPADAYVLGELAGLRASIRANMSGPVSR